MFFLPDALSILTATHNWVAWRLENVQGRDKPAKIPYNPNTGERAKPNDSNTWSSFDNAVALADKFHGGIGFMFSEGCGYCGIELDEKASSRRSALSQTLTNSQRKKLDAFDDATAMRAGYHMMQAYHFGFIEGIKVTSCSEN